jgi:hypothetical protein
MLVARHERLFRDELRRSGATYAAAVVLLCLLLMWLSRTAGSGRAAALLTGVLSGLSGAICLFLGLAVLQAWVTGRGVATAASDPLLLLAPLGAVLGLLAGLLRGRPSTSRSESQAVVNDPARRPASAAFARRCRRIGDLFRPLAGVLLATTVILLLGSAALVGCYHVAGLDRPHVIRGQPGVGVARIAVPALAGLSVCLIGVGGCGARGPSRGLATGLLVGLVLLTHTGAALMVWDHAVSGRLELSLRTVPRVNLLVPWAAILGGAVGWLIAALLGVVHRWAARSARQDALAPYEWARDAADHPPTRSPTR